jgi:hypothetical protein
VLKRTFTRAAGVSPPWFGRHVYADTRAIARKTADSMWADHRCHRVQRYHGGLTPPLLVARCPFTGENDCRGAHRTSLQKAIFALQKCTFTRAAIVSPPWFSEPHLQVQCDEFPRFELLYGMHSTGGLLPRFWLRMRTLLQMCDSGRRGRHFLHGWLTPAAPGPECERYASYAYSICGFDTFTTGSLRPPLLVAQCRFAG